MKESRESGTPQMEGSSSQTHRQERQSSELPKSQRPRGLPAWESTHEVGGSPRQHMLIKASEALPGPGLPRGVLHLQSLPSAPVSPQPSPQGGGARVRVL